jgi:hypothetical protein
VGSGVSGETEPLPILVTNLARLKHPLKVRLQYVRVMNALTLYHFAINEGTNVSALKFSYTVLLSTAFGELPMLCKKSHY